jgi:hypothetical protein
LDKLTQQRVLDKLKDFKIEHKPGFNAVDREEIKFKENQILKLQK